MNIDQLEHLQLATLHTYRTQLICSSPDRCAACVTVESFSPGAKGVGWALFLGGTVLLLPHGALQEVGCRSWPLLAHQDGSVPLLGHLIVRVAPRADHSAGVKRCSVVVWLDFRIWNHFLGQVSSLGHGSLH